MHWSQKIFLAQLFIHICSLGKFFRFPGSNLAQSLSRLELGQSFLCQLIALLGALLPQNLEELRTTRNPQCHCSSLVGHEVHSLLPFQDKIISKPLGLLLGHGFWCCSWPLPRAGRPFHCLSQCPFPNRHRLSFLCLLKQRICKFLGRGDLVLFQQVLCFGRLGW